VYVRSSPNSSRLCAARLNDPVPSAIYQLLGVPPCCPPPCPGQPVPKSKKLKARMIQSATKQRKACLQKPFIVSSCVESPSKPAARFIHAPASLLKKYDSLGMGGKLHPSLGPGAAARTLEGERAGRSRQAGGWTRRKKTKQKGQASEIA
jgi:hypothetical protein